MPPGLFPEQEQLRRRSVGNVHDVASLRSLRHRWPGNGRWNDIASSVYALLMTTCAEKLDNARERADPGWAGFGMGRRW